MINAASDDREDQPAELLFKEGHITFEEYDHLHNTALKTGQEITKVLVKYGYVAPDELVRLLERQAEEIIIGLFAVEEGGFEFRSGLTPGVTERDFHFNPADMTYKGIMGIKSFTHLQKWCPPMDAVLALSGDPGSVFREVVPDDTDKKILSYINGLYPLKMVLRFSPAHDFETLKRICAFLGAGIISIKSGDETEAQGMQTGPGKHGEPTTEQAAPEKEEAPPAPGREGHPVAEAPGQAEAESAADGTGAAAQSAEAPPEIPDRKTATAAFAVKSVKRERRKWIWVSLTAISIILTLLVLAYVLYKNIRKRSPEPVHTEKRIPLPPFREKLIE